MHIWYRAVCDEHKEMLDMFVNNPKRTNDYLGDEPRNGIINTWMEKHYGCELRLIHRDEQIDRCYEDGYVKIKVIE